MNPLFIENQRKIHTSLADGLELKYFPAMIKASEQMY